MPVAAGNDKMPTYAAYYAALWAEAVSRPLLWCKLRGWKLLCRIWHQWNLTDWRGTASYFANPMKNEPSNHNVMPTWFILIYFYRRLIRNPSPALHGSVSWQELHLAPMASSRIFQHGLVWWQGLPKGFQEKHTAQSSLSKCWLIPWTNVLFRKSWIATE